jgi:hypothetical protein
LNPAVFPEGAARPPPVLDQPADFVNELRARHGIVAGTWDASARLGRVSWLGVVRRSVGTGKEVEWRAVEIPLRPNPTGCTHWAKVKPYFEFKEPVRSRYMLDDLFAEHFPELGERVLGRNVPESSPRPSASPTGGFVYVIKSDYGYKIGKTVNLKDRTRLFSVKLPFPISIEHYAWFEDYSAAERDFHRRFHDKRLEGEWFDLSSQDLSTIKSIGEHVAVPGLQ